MATRFLSLAEVLDLYGRVLVSGGGSSALRDLGALEAALAQPRATFDGVELYPSLVEKAGALGFALIRNHPFVDGNKRIGHAALEVFLALNGYQLDASVGDAERTILDVASGAMDRSDLTGWIFTHLTVYPDP
ncbi:MAG: type II toxin-antitoxin system death-on-curing family toxin [Parvibaculum sp.]|nr:type II toxin-antitoxin system death-on-curing family toxin [Gemmatimonadaceae bacterium]MBX3506928.1 type II toxin-antitoxin system death-on-curing family toxin [Parvibaculum sp.]